MEDLRFLCKRGLKYCVIIFVVGTRVFRRERIQFVMEGGYCKGFVNSNVRTTYVVLLQT